MASKGVLKRLVIVSDAEIGPLKTAFQAFFLVLAAYYLVLPVRDEAAVALGSDVLPSLFAVSLPVTAVAAPAAAAFLGRRGVSRDRAVHQLYRLLAVSMLGFVLLHWAVGLARPGAGVAGKPAAAAAAAARRQLVARQEALAHFDSGVVSIHSGGGGGTNGSASAAQRALLQSSSTSSVNGSADRYQRTLLQNDNASAGAAESGLGGTGIKATAVKSDGSSWQRAVRMAFYLWVSAANLVAVSTMWARAADAFHPNAAARLFGMLGAGATGGQLAGSALAAAAAAAVRQSPPLAAALPTLLMLGAAALLELAGRSAAALGAASPPLAAERSVASSRVTGGAAFLAGFHLIAASPYLRQVAVFVGLNYVVSSAFYFEKTAIVAAGLSSPTSRTALFATINGASAAVIGAVQVLLTGRLLRRLSPSCALAALPLAAAALMAAVAARPSPAMIAGAEILRKVVAYGVARPAREVLFTVVSREEKYRAKVVLDTLVQRLGDAAAAAAFAGLRQPALGFGPTGYAAVALPVCLGWAVLGARLGRRQQGLEAAKRDERVGSF